MLAVLLQFHMSIVLKRLSSSSSSFVVFRHWIYLGYFTQVYYISYNSEMKKHKAHITCWRHRMFKSIKKRTTIKRVKSLRKREKRIKQHLHIALIAHSLSCIKQKFMYRVIGNKFKNVSCFLIEKKNLKRNNE